MANIALRSDEVRRAPSIFARSGVSPRRLRLQVIALLLGGAVVAGGVAVGTIDTPSPSPAAVVSTP